MADEPEHLATGTCAVQLTGGENPMKRLLGKALATSTAVALIALVALAGPAAVAAKDGDVIRTGACSNRSDWKLKLSPEDGRIEVEFEIDTPRVGQTWNVTIKKNGNKIFTGQRTTKAPSGSFTVRQVTSNPAGTDSFVGRAVNLTTGEVCRGTASF
jgi:hypothetical protein